MTTSQMKNLCGDGNGAFRYTASFKVALTQRFSILGDAYATLLNNLSKTDSGVSSNIVKKVKQFLKNKSDRASEKGVGVAQRLSRRTIGKL